MKTKKIAFIVLVLVAILLAGTGFIRNVAPVAAAPAAQTDEVGSVLDVI